MWLDLSEQSQDSETKAEISLVGQGKLLSLRYTWEIEEKPQDGMLVLGSEAQNDFLKAVWLDSYHMGDSFMICEGEYSP